MSGCKCSDCLKFHQRKAEKEAITSKKEADAPVTTTTSEVDAPTTADVPCTNNEERGFFYDASGEIVLMEIAGAAKYTFTDSCWRQFNDLIKDQPKNDTKLLELIASTTTPGLVVCLPDFLPSKELLTAISGVETGFGGYVVISYDTEKVPTIKEVLKLHAAVAHAQSDLLAFFLTTMKQSITPGLAFVPTEKVGLLGIGRTNMANRVLLDHSVEIRITSFRDKQAYVMSW